MPRTLLNLRPLPMLVVVAAGFMVLFPGRAQPEGSRTTEAILADLHDDSGWAVHELDARGGVDIYRKMVVGIPVYSFKGVKDVDVDSTVLFEAIIDFEAHDGLSKDIPLTESDVLGRDGNHVDFFQYLDSPGWTLANDRYWFNRAVITRNKGGVAGHHVQTWEHIDPGLYPKRAARVQDEHESAILTPINYGSWEVIPLAPDRTRLIYRVGSDPGGRLPRAAAVLVTGRTLPDNLLQFEREAKRRAGR